MLEMTAHNSFYIHPITKYGNEAQNVEHFVCLSLEMAAML